ncbi:MAG: methionyl-tRNA formyltransferase [Rhabdochlamydiaceae bacterium]|nr:methionyl-tRNA formyltransferase [Candidatus Amphrikana amoebophyrae]
MKIVFFGTPQFSANILSYLIANNCEIVAVVTMPDRPKGRSKKPQPSAVKVLMQEKGFDLPLFQPEKASAPEFINEISHFHADLFVVVGYGEILSQALLDVPKLASVNIHTSLLPKYRGAAPIQRAIMAGEKVMGITVMKMNAQMDAGEMIAQASSDIPDDWLFSDIENELNLLAKNQIVQTIADFEEGVVEYQEQDLSKVTSAPKIQTEDCFLDFKGRAIDLHNQVRALSPRPAAFGEIEVDGKRLRMKIFKSGVCQDDSNLPPGEVVELTKERLLVACGEGGLEIFELQLEGKGKVDVKQFFAGYAKKIFSFVVLK